MDLFYVWLIGMGLLLIRSQVHERRRAAHMRALAMRLGFHYLGDALPRSFTMDGTTLS